MYLFKLIGTRTLCCLLTNTHASLYDALLLYYLWFTTLKHSLLQPTAYTLREMLSLKNCVCLSLWFYSFLFCRRIICCLNQLDRMWWIVFQKEKHRWVKLKSYFLLLHRFVIIFFYDYSIVGECGSEKNRIIIMIKC